ncbi:helix-turn-helix transcriptional regulator [Salmonella enterica subsp. enterica]|nr:helix-turn-helix transcriptional regulator [Salmonella enterica subsp. enterica serovar Legon]EDT8012641.1 helix-turn-helix transcriptional regulator [Salmonella enterica subsp. enterica]EDU0171515.1 helix-turn-helix transcriptional regulator [Salmonella enterica subsp. enterica serovar Belfast]EIR2646736.1 helix-turn-helix transcriptional regulator [Salmonella enterica subsp. enterica serovar Enteritidis]EJS6056331.1 helix-turn-helix transcriptional regulator [Salmonella enterica]
MTNEMLLTTMGGRMKAMRKKLNLSQNHVAQALGVSISAVSLWEKDRANISSDKIAPLAQVLKCDVEWLLRGNSSNYNDSGFVATEDYRAGDLLAMCKEQLMQAPHETVEHLVHLLQIASSLDAPYVEILLKTAMDLESQQTWNKMTGEEREAFSNWLKNKNK